MRIGQGRFRHLTTRLELAPDRGQRRADRMLRQLCGARLAWHRRRRCFVVYTEQLGGRTTTYMDLQPHELGTTMIFAAAGTVRIMRWRAAAVARWSADRMADRVQRREAARAAAASRAFADERAPAIAEELAFTARKLRGRARTMVDLASAN